MKKIFIYQNTGKERLDKFLQSQISTLSRSQIQKKILSGQVLLNGQISSVHHWLKPGDKISFHNTVNKEKISEHIIEPKIIGQTKDYLIINKPSGLLVHPTDKKETNTLVQWLLKKFPDLKKVGDDHSRPGIVHRLDREASGLMVVALNQKSFTNIKKQFQDRKVKKEYTVLVHGRMLNDDGEIKTGLVRNKKTGLMKVVASDPLAREAYTTYQIEQRFFNFSLLKVQIMTGRTHQIRAHLFSIGHSVVGDKLYQTRDLRKKKKTLDQRIFLHSATLEFCDLQGKKMRYHSALPLELKKFLLTLK
ncbi:MAG: hypothetical protein C3F02_04200 [Parcubacteria group bacterium]|nr:MAG: hypothetical protein C3F02_04200 [Parcubacteria group bacterium]